MRLEFDGEDERLGANECVNAKRISFPRLKKTVEENLPLYFLKKEFNFAAETIVELLCPPLFERFDEGGSCSTSSESISHEKGVQ